MPQNKNHHFVPQFYLRRFGSGGFVAAFNLAARKHIARASIAGQCQRPYLYGKDQSVEAQLTAIEGLAARVIRDAVDDLRLPVVPSEADAALLRFLSYQWGRTPAAGAAANAMATKMARAIFKAPGVVPEDLRHHIDDVEVRHVEPVMFSLQLAASIGPTLLDLQKCILVNETGLEFITSDAPVVMHNSWCEGVTWQGTTGFASAGLQVVLPLSPRRALLLFDRDVYAVGCRQAPVAVGIKESRDVEALNAMQMSTAQNSLYYSGHAATAASIDGLPTTWWKPAEASVAVNRALDEENKSQLVHLFRRSEARLRVSFLRLLKKATRVPLKERSNKYREVAMAVDEALRGPRHERYESPASAVGKVWKTVSD